MRYIYDCVDSVFILPYFGFADDFRVVGNYVELVLHFSIVSRFSGNAFEVSVQVQFTFLGFLKNLLYNHAFGVLNIFFTFEPSWLVSSSDFLGSGGLFQSNEL